MSLAVPPPANQPQNQALRSIGLNNSFLPSNFTDREQDALASFVADPSKANTDKLIEAVLAGVQTSDLGRSSTTRADIERSSPDTNRRLKILDAAFTRFGLNPYKPKDVPTAVNAIYYLERFAKVMTDHYVLRTLGAIECGDPLRDVSLRDKMTTLARGSLNQASQIDISPVMFEHHLQAGMSNRDTPLYDQVRDGVSKSSVLAANSFTSRNTILATMLGNMYRELGVPLASIPRQNSSDEHLESALRVLSSNIENRDKFNNALPYFVEACLWEGDISKVDFRVVDDSVKAELISELCRVGVEGDEKRCFGVEDGRNQLSSRRSAAIESLLKMVSDPDAYYDSYTPTEARKKVLPHIQAIAIAKIVSGGTSAVDFIRAVLDTDRLYIPILLRTRAACAENPDLKAHIDSIFFANADVTILMTAAVYNQELKTSCLELAERMVSSSVSYISSYLFRRSTTGADLDYSHRWKINQFFDIQYTNPDFKIAVFKGLLHHAHIPGIKDICSNLIRDDSEMQKAAIAFANSSVSTQSANKLPALLAHYSSAWSVAVLLNDAQLQANIESAYVNSVQAFIRNCRGNLEDEFSYYHSPYSSSPYHGSMDGPVGSIPYRLVQILSENSLFSDQTTLDELKRQLHLFLLSIVAPTRATPLIIALTRLKDRACLPEGSVVEVSVGDKIRSRTEVLSIQIPDENTHFVSSLSTEYQDGKFVIKIKAKSKEQ